MTNMKFILVLLVLFAALVIVGERYWTQPQREFTPTFGLSPTWTAMVTIQNFTFNPQILAVGQGTTVTWKNQDSVAHRVVSDTGVFDLGNVAPGQTVKYTFNRLGKYPYHCSIHPTMNGTIEVGYQGV